MSYANQVIDYVSKLYRETKAGAQIMFNPTMDLNLCSCWCAKRYSSSKES